MLALTGHVISGDVYAWAAVFILKVNSALNPILYTLTAIIGGKVKYLSFVLKLSI
jgi:leucine-rich repeat-containing G protein-coupled receptor 7/leucine-rich repeat-containing G protein-coupled receptor 8